MTNNKGQSSAEFILAFSFIVLFITVFLKVSINFVRGYLVHYAVFMTSRSYLVQDNQSARPRATDANAREVAINEVYKNILKKNSSIELKFNQPETVPNVTFVGAFATFEQSLSSSKILGGKEKFELRSESFLGRTIPMSECAERVCNAVQAASGSGDCRGAGNHTLWDNGC